MTEEKKMYCHWLKPETQEMVANLYKFDGCPNGSVFVEKAIRYYTGHVTMNSCTDYLPDEVSQSVKRSFKSFEDHMSKMLFRISVELDMMMNVLAASIDVSPSELEKLRGQCVEEVKKTRGQIIFDKAVKYQRGESDE